MYDLRENIYRINLHLRIKDIQQNLQNISEILKIATLVINLTGKHIYRFYLNKK